jgi:hypothetical protein
MYCIGSGVVPDGSFILLARNETVRGAFPSTGVALISPVIVAIFAPSINAATLEIAFDTWVLDDGFLMASSR